MGFLRLELLALLFYLENADFGNLLHCSKEPIRIWKGTSLVQKFGNGSRLAETTLYNSLREEGRAQC
jgi:hypothetical protein